MRHLKAAVISVATAMLIDLTASSDARGLMKETGNSDMALKSSSDDEVSMTPEQAARRADQRKRPKIRRGVLRVCLLCGKAAKAPRTH